MPVLGSVKTMSPAASLRPPAPVSQKASRVAPSLQKSRNEASSVGLVSESSSQMMVSPCVPSNRQ